MSMAPTDRPPAVIVPQPGRVPTYWALVAIMLVALALRGSSLGVTPYNIDEAILSIYANQVAHFQAFHWVGVKTSFGFYNPPFYVYMMAPFFRVSEDPRFAMFGMAMLGTGVVGMAGLTARRLWGSWAAIAVAVLLAFSPTAIDHSRRLWGHDTIPFFSALAIYCTVRSIQSHRRRWMWTAMVWPGPTIATTTTRRSDPEPWKSAMASTTTVTG